MNKPGIIGIIGPDKIEPAEPETKSFGILILASITSGILLQEKGFSKVHEAIEWFAGYPVWTHELPAVSSEVVRPILIEIFPDLPCKDDIADWRATAADLAARYPDEIEFPKGAGKRRRNPVETLEDALDQKRSVAP